ncbi:hypothetical protein PVK06_034873 [Gossypium arboreum]|uniref:Uncharacterized protein n=1 Tax=Gossypium arboreum TaxID=29729 RepID=A0ABR0NFC5_GOSAR|nr:hypothetical protein PVK06_034873 [Gossypium arboreum]
MQIKAVWPTRPHSSHHMAVCCARPCLHRPYDLVSYMVIHTDDHTPVWRLQIHFLAFAEASFSMFRVHTWFRFDAKMTPSLL